jgi:hypothetical protein
VVLVGTNLGLYLGGGLSSEELCGREPDMFRCDGDTLLSCCCDQGASGKMICLSKEASGTLADGGEGSRIEGVFLHPCDGQMMPDVVLHVLAVDALQMAAGHNTGGQGLGGAIGEFINQVRLASQDDGKIGFAIALKLSKGVEFLEDIEAKEGGFVDEKGGLHLLSQHELLDFPLDELCKGRSVGADGWQA